MNTTAELGQHGQRIEELLKQFRLPTVSAELVRRIRDSGQEGALPVLCEVFEMEQQDRTGRRVERLRNAAKLPPAKTFATFTDTRSMKLLRGAENLNQAEQKI